MNKEQEKLDAVVPEKREINMKRRNRRNRRLGAISYMHGTTLRTPFSVPYPS